ncbi:MAG: YigZ family protein, partial [Clostridiales bacterium]|nr:YigZ family protein [Clostridiales bacterium]
MPDNYLTAAGVAESVYVIEKSRFIACIAPVKDAAAAAEFLAGLRKRYYDASHICYAYSLEPGGAQKFSDGGEPQGTAGQPIAEVVKAKRLRHTLIAVVRYFGGKKLGAGGLVRAYTEAAVRAAAA